MHIRVEIVLYENELCINLKEVLKVRDTAIVFYTSEIGKAKVRIFLLRYHQLFSTLV